MPLDLRRFRRVRIFGRDGTENCDVKWPRERRHMIGACPRSARTSRGTVRGAASDGLSEEGERAEPPGSEIRSLTLRKGRGANRCQKTR